MDDKRIDRVWAAVALRPPRSWPAWRFATAAGVLAAAVLVGLFLRARPTPTALAGVVVESGSNQLVTLPDGTSATLRTGARLRYDRVEVDRVETTVERGEVAFDVPHKESRAFVVHAAGIRVVDRGTRFVVDLEGDTVRVSVEVGQVEISRASGSGPPTVLTSGESWASGALALPALAPSTTATALAAQSELPPASSEEPAPASPPASTATSPPSRPAAPGPRELLQSANEARLGGHAREAALAFDTLRRRFREDPRAGLAAFELGRLRLDALGDPKGAAEALADSIALAPNAPFREDAEAHLVEALDQMHDVGQCAAARRAYFARYPNGLHAASVATHCP